MDIVDHVCHTLEHVLGPAAEQLRVVIDAPDTVTLEGIVEDEATHGSVLEAVAHVDGVGHVVDHLHVKPDIGAEAEPKDTEFRNEGDARAMTGTGFRRID
ncbi:MAG TPA: BON domain-containing protein [Polyangiaceae bacterium]